MSQQGTSSSARRITTLLERLCRLGRMERYRRGLNPAQCDALNYIAVANRYSRNPSALADFLGSTRGTVSQTLIALERKGLIARHSNARDGRGVTLELTRVGRTRIESGDQCPVDRAAHALSNAHQSALADLLATMLGEAQRQNNFRTFGMCGTCVHFHRNGAPGAEGGPHRCGLTREPLSDSDSSLICREHTSPQAA